VRTVIFSMSVSADGFIAGPRGEIDWSAPDDALHRFHNAAVGELSTYLCGRRLYEEMLYWERAEASGHADPTIREFAGIWQALPKIVFSRTLTAVEGNARLAAGTVEEELSRLDGAVAVGGAGLAASCIDHVDDFRQFVQPVVLGGGTPYFPPLAERIPLALAETRAFGARVVYLRFRRNST
jgi:dihydrofolate reductase